MSTARRRTADTRIEIVGRTGLTAEQVTQSRNEHGANVLTPPKRDPWWKLFFEKFDDPVIRILLMAAGISLVAGLLGGGHIIEAIGILIAVFLATFLAFINEHRAEKEFDILNQVNDEIEVKVLRDGAYTTVQRKAVVVGDLVLIETGDEIPADGEVLEAVSLRVDESHLTGESLPVTKWPATTVAVERSNAYPPHIVLKSALVADGHGALEVTAVGDNTEIGHTARAASEDTNEITPLNRQLDRLAKLIGVLGFSIAAVTFVGLVIRAVITKELSMPASEWWVMGAIAAGLGVGLQRIWMPVIFDALELMGLDVKPPAWLEKGGLGGWLRTVGGGAFVFAVTIGAMMIIGEVPKSPSQWVTLPAINSMLSFFMIAVVIIVVAVPEGLAMSVTLSLAYSMRKMTAANNLVRRMHACETIGAATVICTDKTGTLTQNRMRIYQAGLAGLPQDESSLGAAAISAWAETEIGRRVVEGIAGNSTANLTFEDEDGQPLEEPRAIGNPTEGATLLWLEEAGLSYLTARENFNVERQWAFNTIRKYMATLGGEDRVLHVKGAPEIVLEQSAHTLGPDGSEGPIGPVREQLEATLLTLQGRGMRTLGFAMKRVEGDVPEDIEELANDLVWLGFVAIADPVRSDVPAAIEATRRAGINVKIVTGDTAATAQEIARQVSLLDESHHGILRGPEFAAMDDEEAKQQLEGLRVLARARPADKLRLVRLLQEQGEVVAVTGDGTNDAPALNYADVGLAMGKSGTAVAKEAADIILLDDSFPSVVNAVKWGRSLYLNIQRFILFQLTINVAACIVAMLGPYIGIELPLTVMQMLWVNLIMDTFAALALATEAPRPEVLLDKPRNAKAFIITPRMGVNILGTGGIFVVIMLLLLKTSFLGEGSEIYELTLFFNFFVMLQFFNLFNARTLGTNRSGLAGLLENPSFLLIAAAILAGQIVIVQFGGTVFRTEALSLADWLRTSALCSLVLVIGEAIRWTRRRAEDAV
ncbi:MAG: calcium-translocating P-type ATPase, PMCA-type [Planctomycetota bacterium]